MGCGIVGSNNYQADESEQKQKNKSTVLNSNYEIKQLIGQGTYGKVYRCINKTNNKDYALKVIKLKCKNLEDAKPMINNLKSQISLLRKIDHPNIVKYYNFDVQADSNSVQIVLELVNKSLKNYINQNGELNEIHASSICKKILQALQYLHAHNIIHRDLKCANILMTEEGQPKITDFGTAKQTKILNTDNIAQQCDSLKGTPYYMAPQILKRTGHDKSADIWSLGCTLIEMLSGHPPWSGQKLQFKQIIKYIVSGVHPPYPPRLSKQCQCFLESCFNILPKSRLKAQQLLQHRFIKREVHKKIQKFIYDTPIKLINNHPKKENQLKEYQVQLYGLNSIEIQPTKKKIVKNHKIIKNSNEKSFPSKKSNTIKYLQQDKQDPKNNIIKGQYFTKNKKSKAIISHTTPYMKLREENIINPQQQAEENQLNKESDILCLNTKVTAENIVINTMISREERNHYLEQQQKLREQKQQQKIKWEKQLKEGADLLRKQFSNRYIC